jgi:hypothetical protein
MWVHFQQDALGRDAEPRYVRHTDGREVDFVAVDLSLRSLKARFPGADAWQVSTTGTRNHVTPEGIRVAPALAPLREPT